MVGFTLYGPVPLVPVNRGALFGGEVYPEGIDLDTLLVSPSIFDNSSVAKMPYTLQLFEPLASSMLEWHGTAMLTRSGAYAVSGLRCKPIESWSSYLKLIARHVSKILGYLTLNFATQ